MDSSPHHPRPRRSTAAPGLRPSAPVPADEVLVTRTLAGEREAFDQLVHRHHRALFNYVLRMIGSRDLAADLTQEVFLRAYQALDRFDPAYRFTTWIYRIASNRVIDHVRRRRAVLVPIDGAAEGARGPVLVANSPNPERHLLEHESASGVGRALADLPAHYRDLIVLRHFQHRSYEDIAQIKGSPLGTVKNRLFRAREALRRRLAP